LWAGGPGPNSELSFATWQSQGRDTPGSATGTVSQEPRGGFVETFQTTRCTLPPDQTRWKRSGAGTWDVQPAHFRNRSPASASTANYMTRVMQTLVDQELLLRVQRLDTLSQGGLQWWLRGGTQTSGQPSNGYFFQFVCNGVTDDIYVSRRVTGTDSFIAATVTGITHGADVWVRVRLVGGNIKLRQWLQGASEPGTWNYDATDGSPLLTGGRMLLAGETGAAGSQTDTRIRSLQLLPV
jgi:hypothetical protein